MTYELEVHLHAVKCLRVQADNAEDALDIAQEIVETTHAKVYPEELEDWEIYDVYEIDPEIFEEGRDYDARGEGRKEAGNC